MVAVNGWWKYDHWGVIQKEICSWETYEIQINEYVAICWRFHYNHLTGWGIEIADNLWRTFSNVFSWQKNIFFHLKMSLKFVVEFPTCPIDNDNNNMFISYSWYNNEMVQIQMENMPKIITIHMHHIWAVHRVTRVRIHLSFKTIRIFDITVQQYLITCNFPNQIRQFGWIKYWQVITIVFTCCKLFYRSYSITCFNINSAGSVFAQIIIGAIP